MKEYYNIKNGDILILKENHIFSGLSYKKGDRFKIINLLKTSDEFKIVYLVLQYGDNKIIHFCPNMDYFATVEEYLCINRDDKLGRIGIEF